MLERGRTLCFRVAFVNGLRADGDGWVEVPSGCPSGFGMQVLVVRHCDAAPSQTHIDATLLAMW